MPSAIPFAQQSRFDLVLQDAKGSVTIVLDAKQLTQAGSVRVSTNAAGGTNQLSSDWVRTVLGRIDENSPAYAAIRRAQESNTLVTAVGGVNRKTGELIVVPVSVTNQAKR